MITRNYTRQSLQRISNLRAGDAFQYQGNFYLVGGLVTTPENFGKLFSILGAGRDYIIGEVNEEREYRMCLRVSDGYIYTFNYNTEVIPYRQ